MSKFLGLLALISLAACGNPDDSGDTHTGETDTNEPSEKGWGLVNSTFDADVVNCFVNLDEEEKVTTTNGTFEYDLGEYELMLGSSEDGVTEDGYFLHKIGDGEFVIAEKSEIDIVEGTTADDPSVYNVSFNRHISGEWTCQDRNDHDDTWTEETEYTEGHMVYLPRLGDLDVDGEHVEYLDDGLYEVDGAFTSPTTLMATLHRTDGSDVTRVYDCWAGDEGDKP